MAIPLEHCVFGFLEPNAQPLNPRGGTPHARAASGFAPSAAQPGSYASGGGWERFQASLPGRSALRTHHPPPQSRAAHPRSCSDGAYETPTIAPSGD